jgi:cytochrome c-type biogenesis protein CcmH/NrfG
MQYSSKDFEFLGKQVAAGRYVTRTTFALALVLALLAGAVLGRYVFPYGEGGGGGQKRPLGQESPVAQAVNPNKQLLDSIMQHEKEVSLDPTNVEAWEHLGNLYFDAGEAGKAVNAYNKALAINPKSTSVLVDCGVMYRELKEYDKALEYFRKALDIDPKHQHALFNSGVVLMFDLNRKDEALKAWRALVEVNPKATAPSGELVSKLIQDMS